MYVCIFFYLYIEHAPLLSVVLHAVLQFIYMCSRVISTVHCLLSTLLHIIKVYRFNKPAKDLLVLVDQVLFARWPRSYMSYHSMYVCMYVCETALNQKVHTMCNVHVRDFHFFDWGVPCKIGNTKHVFVKPVIEI